MTPAPPRGHTNRRCLGVPSRVRQVLSVMAEARDDLDADTVHRLRVALRRCRSVSELLSELDPHPAWSESRRLSRKLFARLGALRDAQVLRQWAEALASGDDASRKALLATLGQREARARARARRALGRFDQDAWQRLAATLGRRARLVNPDGLALQCLALQCFDDLRRRHDHALRGRQAEAWHRLRVALKRFRYAVETLLPRQQRMWNRDLRQAQDLLGWIHDLDVFRAFLRDGAPALTARATAALRHAARTSQAEYRTRYRALTEGTPSMLDTWRAGLPHGARIAAAVTARLDATTRALCPHPSRTARVTTIALALADRLTRNGLLHHGCQPPQRAVLRAAAQLHDVRRPGRGDHGHEPALDTVRALTRPPGWTSTDWDAVARVIQAAAEHTRRSPATRSGPARQPLVHALAAFLRLARALERAGATHRSRIRLERHTQGWRLRVSGLSASGARAEGLADAMTALQPMLRRPVRLVLSPQRPGA